MTKTFLHSTSSAETNFPKDLLIWNYWDHEHIVGTHFDHYKKVNVIYEDEKVCFSERWAKLPFIPFYLKTTDFCIMTNETQMDVHHYALFNFIYCKQTFIFEENTPNKCKVIKHDYIQVPKFMKLLQPLFNKIMKKWFINVWEEDMPMRNRRLKVWKLGFKHFKGIDYINNPNIDKIIDNNRDYKVKLPIPKITQIKNNTRYFICNNCKAIYRNKALSSKEEKLLYDKELYKPVKGGKIYDLLKKFNAGYEKHHIIKLLSRHKKKYPFKILDIACGKGYLLNQLVKNQNFNCVGLDINSNNEENRIKYIKASYTNIDIIKKINPDLIIINNFIEHMEDPRIINKILNIIKNKCSIIIITPNTNSNGQKYFKDCWSGFHAPRHKIIFNEKNILKIFKIKNNYRIEIGKLYDPFTNLISTANLIKKLKADFSITTFLKLMLEPILLFLDIFNKNRIIIHVKKN